jgi:hypothetical protein
MTIFADVPANIDTLVLIACVALTSATMIFIFLIQPDPSDSAPHRSYLDQLLERRDTIYENLRDLKFEYRTGKFAEQDYEQMRQTLEAEAALVLAEIETVTGNEARLPRRDPNVRGPALPAGGSPAGSTPVGGSAAGVTPAVAAPSKLRG